MKTHKPILFVVVGGRGNLVELKLLYALWTVYSRDYVPRQIEPPFHILAADVHPMTSKEYRAWVEEKLKPKLQPSEPKGWTEFLKLFDYVQNTSEHGENSPMIKTIQEYQQANPEGKVRLYLAVPYLANIPLLKQLEGMCRCETTNCSNLSIFFEKPAEITVEALEQIDQLRLACRVPERQIGIVEHFFRKPGVQNYLISAYQNPANNAALRSKNISEVQLTITEIAGTNGRTYAGTAVDSFFNHVAFLLGITLDNPNDPDPYHKLSKIVSHIGKLAFEPPPGLGEEELAKHRAEFYQAMRPIGVYARCNQDHCKERGERTPTAARFEFYPNTPRWSGTRWIVSHAKNAHRKGMSIRFVFKKEPGAEHGAVWEYHFEDFPRNDSKDRYCGWVKEEPVLRIDGLGTELQILDGRRLVGSEFTDGYPHVVRAALEGDMQGFMPLTFQAAALCAMSPWAAALDAAGAENEKSKDGTRNNIWFNIGSDPFSEAMMKDVTLTPLM